MYALEINNNLTLDNFRIKNEKKKDNWQHEKKFSVCFETFYIKMLASNKACNHLHRLYTLIPPRFYIYIY